MVKRADRGSNSMADVHPDGVAEKALVSSLEGASSLTKVESGGGTREADSSPGVSDAQPGTKGKATHFDPKTLESIKVLLLAQRDGLLEQLREIEEVAFNASQSELSGEVSYDEDFADAGSFTFEREKDLSIAQNVQDLVSKIAKALGKIEEGSYGICESCGEPIEAARMKALPHVLLCIRCKRAEERR